jgi:hypothetical protein
VENGKKTHTLEAKSEKQTTSINVILMEKNYFTRMTTQYCDVAILMNFHFCSQIVSIQFLIHSNYIKLFEIRFQSVLIFLLHEKGAAKTYGQTSSIVFCYSFKIRNILEILTILMI